MNMPLNSPTYTAPRRLDEDVFQTAEEAVLVEGLGNAAVPPSSDSSDADPHRSRRHTLPFSRAVAAHVAARPCQSALMAAVAGALAMLVLRSQLRGKFQRFRLR